MTASGRFPLHPGRPLVFRRPNGAWGFSCVCLERNTVGNCHASDRHNCDDWEHAVREALDHLRYWHKSPAVLETEALERLFLLPSLGEVA